MLEIKNLQVSRKSSLFVRGKKTTISILLSSIGDREAIPVALLLERMFQFAPKFLATLTQAEVSNENGKTIYSIKNLRGRPPESFKNIENLQHSSNYIRAKTEELFYSSGNLFSIPKNIEDYPESIEELKQEPFQYRINTKFSNYRSSKQIVHSVSEEKSPNIKDAFAGEFELKTLFRLIPAKLDLIRIGIEKYSPSWFGSMLGSSVSINSRFFLEVSSKQILLHIEEQNTSNPLPFAEEEYLLGLSKSLNELSLFSGLIKKIEVALK